jgi:hypothetical protein
MSSRVARICGLGAGCGLGGVRRRARPCGARSVDIGDVLFSEGVPTVACGGGSCGVHGVVSHRMAVVRSDVARAHGRWGPVGSASCLDGGHWGACSLPVQLQHGALFEEDGGVADHAAAACTRPGREWCHPCNGGGGLGGWKTRFAAFWIGPRVGGAKGALRRFAFFG